MQGRATSASPCWAVRCSLLALAGCAQAIEPPEVDGAGGPSQDSFGGASGSSSGGSIASGGSLASGGNVFASGGSSSKGGSTGSGGATSRGGSTSSAGSTAKGGATSASGGSTGKAGAQLFFDDFEDGNADGWIPADTYGTWATQTQDASLAYVVLASSKATSVGGDSSWGDQLVEAKVKVVTTTGSPVIRLLGRWQALKSYLVLEFRPGDASDPEADLKLRRTLDGGTTDLCRFKPASALGTEWNTIGFSIQGSAVTIYFDGSPVVPEAPCAAVTEPTNGGIALGMEAGTAAFDDVRVTVP